MTDPNILPATLRDRLSKAYRQRLIDLKSAEYLAHGDATLASDLTEDLLSPIVWALVTDAGSMGQIFRERIDHLNPGGVNAQDLETLRLKPAGGEANRIARQIASDIAFRPFIAMAHHAKVSFTEKSVEAEVAAYGEALAERFAAHCRDNFNLSEAAVSRLLTDERQAAEDALRELHALAGEIDRRLQQQREAEAPAAPAAGVPLKLVSSRPETPRSIAG